jgi:hypothetical protein
VLTRTLWSGKSKERVPPNQKCTRTAAKRCALKSRMFRTLDSLPVLMPSGGR